MKIKLVLFVLGLFCSFNITAQEEFFRNNNGLSISYSKNFTKNINSSIHTKGISYYNKGGLILSGNFASSTYGNSVEGSLGYLFNGSTSDNKIKTLFALSYGNVYDYYKYAGPTMGLIKVFFPASNFPFSIGASSSMLMYFGKNISQDFNLGASIAYSQAFFSKSPIYPVIGITKTFIITNNGGSDWFYHLGLSIKLGK